MTGNHRNMGRPSKFAVAGAATVAATALTVAIAAPKPPVNADVALAASTGPYTEAVTGGARAMDSALVFAGAFGGAAAAFWNPIAGWSGGWLPTFTARTTQKDLTTTEGLLAASSSATGLDVVPGISGDATVMVIAATAETLSPGAGDEVEAVADTVLLPLASIKSVIDALNALNQAPGVGRQIAGVPTVEDVLDVIGLTATQTEFVTTFNWPLFAASGKTSLGSTFIQLPSHTAAGLVNRISDRITVAGVSLSDAPPEVQKLVGDTLAPLDDVVSTPTLTAWIPAGSGSYRALGGSLGLLAAAPIVVVGPVDALSKVPLPAGLPNLGSETVVAVPIAAEGAELPYGISSFGVVAMPAVITPAGAVVSPPILASYTRQSTPSTTYVGTDGIAYNSGSTVGLLLTSLGPVPVVYSLGSVNAGTSGAGVTGPSLFGVSTVPTTQVGTAPGGQSLDGPVSEALTNLGVANNRTPVSTALRAPLSSTLGPLNPQIEKALNGVFGPAVKELAQQMVALNEVLTQTSQAVEEATQPVEELGKPLPPATPAAPAPAPALPGNLLAAPAPVVSNTTAAVANVAENLNLPPADSAPRTRPRLNVITGTGNPGGPTTIGNGRTSGGPGGANAPGDLRSTVQNTTGGLRSTVQDAPKKVTDAVSGTVKSVTDKVSDAVSGTVGGLGKLGGGGDDG
ncbi:hypothetical protein H7I77_00375 [Mycolicibacterium novocastrense]|uniref:PE-PPE domain-containing protein n=2 Tax=Mycolicibacterium novocastrense TaxID=59813 RepID=A0AAW5SDG9_MYCNV|nr:hypothetical protein [Mycolicibacterium novocastrense]MCV7021812.1 hypothetical protein [Mycolicibacterium novocastrense]